MVVPVAAMLGLAIGALIWGVVDANSHRTKVMRNVSVLGIQIGGTDRVELERRLDQVEDRIRATPVRIATTDGGFSAPGTAFGLTLDRPSLRAEALSARRPVGVVDRMRAYLGSFVTKKRIVPRVFSDVNATEKTLSKLEGPTRRDPVDPQLKLRNGRFITLPGSDGDGIDAKALAGAISAAVERGQFPITVAANRVPLPSSFTTEELQALADQATQRTASPIAIVAGDKDATISPEQLRRWVRPAIVNRRVTLTLDDKQTLAGIRALVGSTVKDPVSARLVVGATGVEAIPSSDGLDCCQPDTVARVQAVFEGTSPAPAKIDLVVVPPRVTTDEAVKLNVKEPIGTFTTKHKAGEDRVKNIHRIADLLRGEVIKPGETFSVNDVIGPRTEAKGFVQAHVIEDGVFKDAFGGGISQFATTLFNAAFFGGLDILQYKPHSIYISRYPFGREATLAYPQVDLKLRNNTPYGVMIWPTYTDSTITVTLYSTAFVKGEPVDQQVTLQGLCKRVVTTRQRTYLDGHTSKDTFRAVYFPKEGVTCTGSPTPGATTIPPPAPRPSPATVASASGATGSTSVRTKPTAVPGRTATTDKPAKPTATPTPTETKPPAKTTPPDAGGGVVVARPPVTGVG